MVKSKSKKHHNMTLRGKVWYFVAMVKGKRYSEVLSTNEYEALSIRDDYLYEIRKYGKVVSNRAESSQQAEAKELLFGEVAQIWSKIKTREFKMGQIKKSTLIDYKCSMNVHILPYFGNRPIQSITASDVDDFVLTRTCSAKRINNILVPMRSLFKMAKKRRQVSENIMHDVDNLRLDEPDIFPLSMAEVKSVLENVTPHFKPFFISAFLTGMRFGEMAALKWKNVDFTRGLIRIRETRVCGEEGRPKTKRSKRDIDILPPVHKALQDQLNLTGKDDYVFRNESGALLTSDHVLKSIWTPALEKAKINYRPMMQTRHTFATIMIDAGEELGWVQQMLGHSSLQMIYTRYYSWVKKDTRNDGSAFLKKMYKPEFEEKPKNDHPQNASGKIVNFTSILHQAKKKGLKRIALNP